jgi:hypothetical protein
MTALTQATRRALRPSEVTAGTDFTGMDATWRSLTASLYGRYRSQLDRAIVETVARVEKITNLRDLRRVAPSTDLPWVAVLADALQQMSLASAQAAVDELAAQGAQAQMPSVLELGKLAGARATALARVLDDYVAQAAQSYLLRAWSPDRDIAAIEADLDAHLRSLSFRWSFDHLGGAMTAAQNEGRRAVLSGHGGVWEASEILDGSTCPPCLGVDGTTYDTYEAAVNDYPAGGYKNCLGGSRCRGTLIKLVSP